MGFDFWFNFETGGHSIQKNSDCNALDDPWDCCSGFGTGNCGKIYGKDILTGDDSQTWKVWFYNTASGDWGDLTPADKRENNLSLKEGYRIFSSYNTSDGKLWIITEADRSVTTFLLPEDY